MSSTTPSMSLTKPDPGGSIGTWSQELNSTIEVIDAHDHTSGKGVRVPTAGLNVNADLPLNNFAATQVKALDLAPVAASTTTSYATALYVDSADNELYWRTSGGVAVKLTLATSLNAALLGGFTGDYGAGGSQANFTSGTAIYNFLRAANHRAFIDASDIRLFQGTSGITNAVKLRSPNALAASYDVVFPTALPASTKLLSMSSAGQLAHTGTAATMDGALTVTGLVTASAGVTAAAGQHVTVSGAGLYKRGTRVRHVSAMQGVQTTGTTGNFTNAAGAADFGGWTSGNAADVFKIPLDVHEGERITAVAGRVNATSGGVISMAIYRADTTPLVVPTRTQLGSTANSVGNDDETLTVSGLTETVDTQHYYYFAEFTFSANTAHRIFGVLLTTDVP